MRREQRTFGDGLIEDEVKDLASEEWRYILTASWRMSNSSQSSLKRWESVIPRAKAVVQRGLRLKR
jgi:hypothetical protein